MEGERSGSEEYIKNLQEEVAKLREALKPFAQSSRTIREPIDGPAEDDVLLVEAKMGDWLRACIAVGTMDAEYLRALPDGARPSERFIQSLESE